ncbi:MAG TPA: type II secretion system secretin GspD [Geminicoccaceae bacterium]|nr:type II secretion system secretin GspD [Geminicoccaceae bacterium]
MLLIALVGCASDGPQGSRPKDVGLLTSPLGPSDETSVAPQPLFPSEQTGATPVLASPEIYNGSGNLFGTLPGRSGLPDVSAAGQVTLNFVEADIREVIGAIVGDALGLSYAIDPAVNGSVTIRTTRPLPPDAVLPLVEDLLAANGVALVETDGVIRAMPMENAPRVRGGPRDHPGGFGLHVFPLRFASASALSEVLEPFVPANRVLRVDGSRNLLVFSGSSGEAAGLEELVGLFDVDWIKGMSFALFPVSYANPETLVSELDVVFGQEEGALAAGLVSFLPINRMRAILAITPQPLYLSEVEAWVRRLDRGEESVGQRIYVYRVQNGQAAELAQLLSELFGEESAEGLPAEEVAPGLIPTTISSRSASLSGARRAGGMGRLGRGDSGRGARFGRDTTGEIQVAEATPPAAVSTEGAATTAGAQTAALPTTTGGAGRVSGEVALGGELGGLRIVADQRNNALLVMATPSQYRLVLGALEQLDVRPLQVLIEATVAEVALNDTLNYGVEWFFQSGSSTITFSSLSGAIAPAFPGFSYFLNKEDVKVVINALAAITKLKFISSPQLVVLDNETARIQVGDEVPVATQTAVSVTDADAPLVSTIQFRSTGVILEVTPRVNAGGLVTLELSQEVSRATPTTTSSLNSPTITQRLVQTSVAVQSGEVIALGGLIQDGGTFSTTGVPLLSELPIVGNLFKTTRNDTDRTELLVLMSPHVIRDVENAREVTKDLRRRMYLLETLNTGGNEQ